MKCVGVYQNALFRKVFLLLSFLMGILVCQSQECLVPLQYGCGMESVAPYKRVQALRLPFFDDFSNYTGLPDTARWQPSGAWVNRDYDAMPPTLGMVTLDALDAQGVLYATTPTSLFAADTLQSRPIRLDSLWTTTSRRARLSDSICLSFYYLPGGGSGPEWQHVGSRPGQHDSLILEFWDQERWSRVWSIGGTSVDSLVAASGHRWQRVSVMIENEEYLHAAFAFRFRNLCSLDDNPQTGMVGNTDQWLLDYIELDAYRTRYDSIMHDVAFVSRPPSMLRNYYAMPARQFVAAEMADSLQIVITNRYDAPLATHYQYGVYDAAGRQVFSYDGGYANVPPFLPGEVYQTNSAHAAPPVQFVFPLIGDTTTFWIRHEVHEGVGGDERGENDEMTFEQVFSNYYAYDDGLPEKGYGVVSAGQPRIASMFQLNVADTLTAVDLWFNRTLNDVNTFIMFRLTVWSDAGGVPGAVLYSDATLRRADAEQVGSYQRFVLEYPVVVSGRIYVGLVQSAAGYINLGFDCGQDHHDRCFYSTDNVWHTTVYSGALMLRPYFGHAATVGIETVEVNRSLLLYPNPVRDVLHVNWSNATAATVSVYDCLGHLLLTQGVEGRNWTILSVDMLPKGCYMLVLRDRRGGRLAAKNFCK